MTLDLKTRIWWTFLRGVSVANLLLLMGVGVTTDLSGPLRGSHFVLAAVYTGVCAFRSFFPRVDLERTVLVDHWLSSIVLGRSCATLAEMCFTVQLSLVMFALSPTVPWLEAVGFAIVPLIAVAQVACWAGVLTGNHLWHAVEETLWAVMVMGLAVAGVGLWPEADGVLRVGLGVGWVGCLTAATVMVGIDVPMYVRRWRESSRGGVVFRTSSQGFSDALVRREPTGSWSVWRHEVAWMTPYFSASVWLSLAMVKFVP